MANGLFQKIAGRDGEVRINSLGVLVGEFKHFALARREDDDADSGLYDLRAVFSYVNPHLWGEDYERTITVTIGTNEFRIEQDEGYPAPALTGGNVLIIQGVRLCQ